MNHSIFLVFALLFVSTIGVGQQNEISITFIGNCGLYMTDGTQHIYTDFPYKSGAFNYMEFESAELDRIKEKAIFLFTHKHADHYSKKNLKKVLQEKGGQKYGSWNLSELEKLAESIPDFEIQVFRTKHRFSFSHYSYLIIWHGKRIYLSGDTESAETIGNVPNMDWAFIPYWIVSDAKENNIEIDTKIRALYHFYPNQKIEGEIPEDVVLLTTQNETFRIPY
jgi:L-ascorbate metabolism protein UlaG (beta-lactamase superfamily)